MHRLEDACHVLNEAEHVGVRLVSDDLTDAPRGRRRNLWTTSRSRGTSIHRSRKAGVRTVAAGYAPLMPTAASLGRLHLSAVLDQRRARLLARITLDWTVVDDGRALTPVCRRHVAAAASLRVLVEELFRPHRIQVEGTVVVEQADGELGVITVRRGRVSSRVLWAGSPEPADECRVIDLAVRRAGRTEARP